MRDNLTFILDVDGVLTSGQFLYSIKGKIYKIFGPHDNDGLKMLSDKIDIKFVSADKRGFEITKKRISDMGFQVTLVNEFDRYNYIKKNFGLKNIIYMGDGIHDAKILKDCFFGIAPASGRIEARKAADFVTESNAGEGAVLDASLKILEILIKEK
jgi:3-deoxy-D-manno-octulosonate 8-phosphate phosphatase (KDO 8-P phosphatase)